MPRLITNGAVPPFPYYVTMVYIGTGQLVCLFIFFPRGCRTDATSYTYFCKAIYKLVPRLPPLLWRRMSEVICLLPPSAQNFFFYIFTSVTLAMYTKKEKQIKVKAKVILYQTAKAQRWS
jgi:hypothetical protein